MSKKIYVYKITRVDDLSYIGITVNSKKRFEEHRKSNRFSNGIKEIKILCECNTYEEAGDKEEFYIQELDTFYKGLNLTKNGKGLNENCKFNTFGHKFSNESKKKMSISRKGKPTWIKGKTHSIESKKKMSKLRKGICWKTELKLTDDQINGIINDYGIVIFEDSFIAQYVKPSQKDHINSIPFVDLKSQNGKPLSYKVLYCKYKEKQLGVTYQYIKNILEGKHGSTHHTQR